MLHLIRNSCKWSLKWFVTIEYWWFSSWYGKSACLCKIYTRHCLSQENHLWIQKLNFIFFIFYLVAMHFYSISYEFLNSTFVSDVSRFSLARYFSGYKRSSKIALKSELNISYYDIQFLYSTSLNNWSRQIIKKKLRKMTLLITKLESRTKAFSTLF